MSIIWHTKKINIQKYYHIIMMNIWINSDDGTRNVGYKSWQKFKKEWTVHVIPTDKVGEFSKFYSHIPNIKVSQGIAWGITGSKEMFLFIVDSRNPFIIRSNAMAIGHECLHAVMQDKVGTFHITRHYDSPEGKVGTKAPAATVIVHDAWYGNKPTLRFWIGWGLGWIPITMPFMQVKKAKELYPI